MLYLRIPENIMSSEPSETDRQRLAFNMLREHARSAHLQGDGLRVANLSATALQELDRLITQKQFKLLVRDVQWAFIFHFYWLLRQSDGQMTGVLLSKLPLPRDEERSLLDLLKTYHYLIEQPLDASDAVLDRLDTLGVDAFGEEPNVEMVELVRHLLELAWFRSATTGRWIGLLDRLLASGVKWITESLSGYRDRLTIQVRLTMPDRDHPCYSEDDAPRIAGVSPLAELWLLHLRGKGRALIARVQRLSVTSNAQDYKWRQTADYWFTNRRFEIRQQAAAKNVTIHPEASSEASGGPIERRMFTAQLDQVGLDPPQLTDDSDQVWLARRRSMSSEFPVLAFHDQRMERIDNCLATLFRTRTNSHASRRFEVWQMAMLHELAALRLWDFGMWRDAINAQGQVDLESVQWIPLQSEIAVHGMSQLVRSLDFPSPKKDWLAASAFKSLEFSPESVRRKLIDTIVCSYPRQQYSASELLEYVGDLAPESDWNALASWTVEFAKQCRSNELGGWKLNCLKHWSDILPCVSEDSNIWKILADEILFLCRISHGWRGGDIGKVLRAWLVWAPLDYALSAIEAIVSTEPDNLGDRIGRAELATGVEELRPELRSHFSSQLLARAVDLVERNILSTSKELSADIPSAVDLKARITGAIRRTIPLAAPMEPSKGCSFGPFPAGIDEVKDWNSSDIPLIEELIATTNSPNVHREWLWWLLNTLQLIVSNGTAEVADSVVPSVLQWADSPPSGYQLAAQLSSPFSVIQKSDTEGGDIALGIGWLAFQLVRKLPGRGDVAFLAWVKGSMFIGEYDHFSIAIYGAVIAGSRLSIAEHNESMLLTESMILCLLNAEETRDDASSALSGAIRYLASILKKPASEFVDWTSVLGKMALERILSIIKRVGDRLTNSRDRSIRAAFGELLWGLSMWNSLDSELLEFHTKLCADARASVRMASRGGWYAERKRRE